jgi:CheY-like chemotaxis protein
MVSIKKLLLRNMLLVTFISFAAPCFLWIQNGVIMGHSELALMTRKEEEAKKVLELIHSQILRGRNLTRNLIAFVRDQELRQEYIRINEKIELVVNLMNITGMDIYRHIRETEQTLPILFISGNIEFLESARDLKNNDAHTDHLSKPCRNQEYIERINGLLEKADQS